MYRRSVLALVGGAILASSFPHQSFGTTAQMDERRIDESIVREMMGEREAVFVAVDSETNEIFLLNPKRADERHPPFSSFKIPNLIIALETGVAPSLDHLVRWDPARRPAATYWPKDWRQDQTLATAFTRSTAWYFQDLAREIGSKRYRDYLHRFAYGDANAPQGSDSFWLDDPNPARRLTISPREQAMFLLAAIEGRLGLRQSTVKALEEVALLRSKNGSALYGKTGSGPIRYEDFDGAFQGWLAGYVRRPAKKPVTFALYTRGPSFSSIRHFRREMSETLLKTIGALPSDW